MASPYMKDSQKRKIFFIVSILVITIAIFLVYNLANGDEEIITEKIEDKEEIKEIENDINESLEEEKVEEDLDAEKEEELREDKKYITPSCRRELRLAEQELDETGSARQRIITQIENLKGQIEQLEKDLEEDNVYYNEAKQTYEEVVEECQ